MYFYQVQFLPLHSKANPVAGEEWWSYCSIQPLSAGQIVVCEFNQLIAPAIVIEVGQNSEVKLDKIKPILGYYQSTVLTNIGQWCLGAYQRTGITAADWFFLRMLSFPEFWLGLDKSIITAQLTESHSVLSAIKKHYLDNSKADISVKNDLEPLILDEYLKKYPITPDKILSVPEEIISTIPILSNFEESDIIGEKGENCINRDNNYIINKSIDDYDKNQHTIITNNINIWPEVFTFSNPNITKFGITSINQVLKHIEQESAKFDRIAVLVPEKWWLKYIYQNIKQNINIYLTYDNNCIKNIISNLAAHHFLKKAIFVGQRELLFINCLATFDKIIVVDVDNLGHSRQQKPKFHALELLLQLNTPLDLLFSSPNIYFPECKYRIMIHGNIFYADEYLDSQEAPISFTGLNPSQLKEKFGRFEPKRPVLIHHNRIGFGHLFKCRNCGKIIRDFNTGKIVHSYFVNDVVQFITDYQRPVNQLSANTLFGCPHSELELVRYGIDGLAFDLNRLGFEVQIIEAQRKFSFNPLTSIYICTNAIHSYLPQIKFGLIAAFCYTDNEAKALMPVLNRLAWKFADDQTALEIIHINRSSNVQIESLPIASEFVSDILSDRKQIKSTDFDEEDLDEFSENDNFEEDFDLDLYQLLGLPPFGCQIEIAVRVKLHAPAAITKKIDELVKAFKPITFRIFKGFVQTNYRVHLYRALIKPDVDLKQLSPLLTQIRKLGGQPVIRWDRLGL